jgi:glycosyltransferase involved in cell wall biosynthesis
MEKTTKKIDVIVKYFYPVAAGIETNVLETYSILAKLGWDITIHTSLDTLTEKNVLEQSYLLRGLKIKRYPYKWYGYMPEINWNTTDLVALHNFNISHSVYLFYSLWRKITLRKKYALVVTPHGGFTPEWRIFKSWVAWLKSTYHKTIGVLLIDLVVDRVRAVSEWEREEIVKLGVPKKKVVVISNGIENDAYRNIDVDASHEIKVKVKSYGKYLIQVGRVYMIKNYETVIRALPSIPADVNFVIAGAPEKNEDYKHSLIELAKSLGVEKRLIFAGVVRGVDKYYLMKHAQMMVHMAMWESFCNVIHEAMSQGQVIVAADNSALPYLVKNHVNGFLIPTTDDRKLAERINFVLEHMHSPEIKLMRDVNREYGLKDSWEGTAKHMDTLYNELTS